MSEKITREDIYRESRKKHEEKIEELLSDEITSDNIKEKNDTIFLITSETMRDLENLEITASEALSHANEAMKKAEKFGVTKEGNFYFNAVEPMSRAIKLYMEDILKRNFMHEKITEKWNNLISSKLKDVLIKNEELEVQMKILNEKLSRFESKNMEIKELQVKAKMMEEERLAKEQNEKLRVEGEKEKHKMEMEKRQIAIKEKEAGIQLGKKLQKRIENLDGKRITFNLFSQGKSSDEIADVLEIDITTVIKYIDELREERLID